MFLITGLCLLAGALLCCLAAVGILRLPDVFMRLHAATKAGVVGGGLILIGVAIHDGGALTTAKVGVAITFLLLTTPVAGHFLGRAAYVSGAPFWQGTTINQLESVITRRHFGAVRVQESSAVTSPDAEQIPAAAVSKVLIALAEGPHMDAAIDQAIVLAQQHDAELCGIAIIDIPGLSNVGPVPIGAGHHAAGLRKWRIAKARCTVADVIERLEWKAKDSGLRWSVRIEEGKPHAIVRGLQEPGCLMAVAPGGWFDQGVLESKVPVARRLVDSGISPIFILGTTPADEVRRIHFSHDGSQRSLKTWRRLMEANPWPQARFVIGVTPGCEHLSIDHLLRVARDQGHRADPGSAEADCEDYVVIGNAGSRGWWPEWLNRSMPANDEKILAIG